MLTFVDRVPPDPLDGSHLLRRPVVDARPRPAVDVKRLQRAAECIRSRRDLASDVVWSLFVVPLLDNTLVPTHRSERGLVLGECKENPLSLHPEHVAHVTAVLERRPGLDDRVRSQHVVPVTAEHRGVSRCETPKCGREFDAGDGLVHETALVAPVHTRKVDRRTRSGGNNVVVGVAERVEELLAPHPAVERVELVGSRGGGDATALSDWDFQIHTTDAKALVVDLPALVRPLEPLAAQWDRLVERAVYMLVLRGPTKVDLFPGEETRKIEPPWEPTPANLAAIDAHFWDWTLWLGSKALHRRTDVVDQELQKLHHNLLGPLGVADPPPTIDAAVAEYRRARDRLEREWSISIERELGDEVSQALQRNGVIGGR
jgi:hypothetical protein